MLATKVICPYCRKRLKMSKPSAAGHRILCSRCGRSFAVPSDAVAFDGPINRDPKRSAEPVGPASRRSSAPLRVAAKQTLWIGVVLGGLLLLLTATIGMLLYFVLGKGPREAPVQTSLSSSDAGNANASPPRDSEVPPPQDRRQDPPRQPGPPLPANVPSAEPERPWLPPQKQEQVNKAIDRGVQWLQKHPAPDHSWRWGNTQEIWTIRVGLPALQALTLLECGVPGNDNRIQELLHRSRKGIPNLAHTYELALAILFLDRLGDPADEKRIQTCALRLVAGQSPSGGWTYTCPLLTPEQESDLLMVMRARRPRNSLDLFVGGPGGSAPPGFLTGGPNAPLTKDLQGEPSVDSKLLPEGGAGPLDKALPSPAEVKGALERLPVQLRKLPSLQPPQESHQMPRGDGTDDSNTQFAILGLLAAGHYDLPLQRTYALIVQRFHVSQVPDGQWNYRYSSPGRPGGSPAMTGAGLLGLAVQYGLAHDQERSGNKVGQIQDPAVEKGFNYLARSIGEPLGAKKPRPKKNDPINYYFLWTVERCGVLYKCRQIGGKDWYPWGVELLLDHQQPDGHWTRGSYPGSMPIVDTCFALLFLKRANLAKELTKKLEFFLEGKQLQSNP